MINYIFALLFIVIVLSLVVISDSVSKSIPTSSIVGIIKKYIRHKSSKVVLYDIDKKVGIRFKVPVGSDVFMQTFISNPINPCMDKIHIVRQLRNKKVLNFTGIFYRFFKLTLGDLSIMLEVSDSGLVSKNASANILDCTYTSSSNIGEMYVYKLSEDMALNIHLSSIRGITHNRKVGLELKNIFDFELV